MNFGEWNQERRLNRRRRARVLLLALGLVVASSAGAHARDLCMSLSGGGTTVLKRFRIPGANRCETLQGILAPGSGLGAMTGTACTEAGRASMTMHYTLHAGQAFYFESAYCRVKLPMTTTGATGQCIGQYLEWPFRHDRFIQGVTLYPCEVDVPY